MSEVGFEGAVDGLGVETSEACGEVIEVGAEVGESVQVVAGGVAVGVGEEGGVGGVCPGVEPFLITVDGVDGVVGGVGAGEGGLVGELFVDGGVALSGGVEVVLVGEGLPVEGGGVRVAGVVFG